MSESTRIDNSNREIIRSAFNGWFMLVVNFVLFFGGLALFLRELQRSGGEPRINWLILLGIALPILAVILLGGLFTLQPNEARVLILFGAYHETVRTSGFSWANPFYSRAARVEERWLSSRSVAARTSQAHRQHRAPRSPCAPGILTATN